MIKLELHIETNLYSTPNVWVSIVLFRIIGALVDRSLNFFECKLSFPKEGFKLFFLKSSIGLWPLFSWSTCQCCKSQDRDPECWGYGCWFWRHGLSLGLCGTLVKAEQRQSSVSALKIQVVLLFTIYWFVWDLNVLRSWFCSIGVAVSVLWSWSWT